MEGQNSRVDWKHADSLFIWLLQELSDNSPDKWVKTTLHLRLFRMHKKWCRLENHKFCNALTKYIRGWTCFGLLVHFCTALTTPWFCYLTEVIVCWQHFLFCEIKKYNHWLCTSSWWRWCDSDESLATSTSGSLALAVDFLLHGFCCFLWSVQFFWKAIWVLYFRTLWFRSRFLSKKATKISPFVTALCVTDKKDGHF